MIKIDPDASTLLKTKKILVAQERIRKRAQAREDRIAKTQGREAKIIEVELSEKEANIVKEGKAIVRDYLHTARMNSQIPNTNW